jgi:glycosyltransferase involved in cell wall biosynthesis
MSVPVSVILPTFNRAHTLRRAIESVLAQSHAELELIVVDDASTDNTAGLVEAIRDARVRYLPQGVNRGPAAARNTGIRAARHALIAFQDSDDRWLPGKLAAQLEQLAAAPPGVALVSCGLQRILPHAIYSFPPAALLGPDVAAALRQHAVAFSQTWLVRRETFDRFGLFDEQLRIWEDWEFLLRVTRGAEVRHEAEPRVSSTVSADAISASVAHRIESLERILATHGALENVAFRARVGYLIGRFRALAGDRGGARTALTTSLRLDPLQAKAWVMLGALTFGTGAVRAIIARENQRAASR